MRNLVIACLIFMTTTGFLGFNVFDKMAPKCDDKAVVATVIESLKKENLDNQILSEVYTDICGEYKADYDRLYSEMMRDANRRANRASDLTDWMEKEKRTDSARQDLVDCDRKVTELNGKLVARGLRYDLKDIRTTAVNKETGSNTCIGNLLTNSDTIKEVTYKVELTDGGKKNFITVSWKNGKKIR